MSPFAAKLKQVMGAALAPAVAAVIRPQASTVMLAG
jgi:hypothetical protein